MRQDDLGAYHRHMGRSVSATKGNVYLLGELGALVGAVLAAPLAAGVVYGGVGLSGFETLEDLARRVVILLTIGALVLIIGSSIGFWFALRRAGFSAAKRAARMLFLLLFAFNLAAVAATREDRVPVLLPVILVPFVLPPLATWVTGSVRQSIPIEGFVAVLVGIGAYGAFARSNVVFPPVPQATPTVVEEEPAPIQLPLGRENPCWAGTYPDDLSFLEAEEVPVRVFFVDLETNDIYYSDCVRRRLSQGDIWPPGVAERLVRSSDL
jgi:hypothetical protein